tara:strand:- start:187 stop:549 length:363 start_codon:yes stop_codon:yes gene_type:complete
MDKFTKEELDKIELLLDPNDRTNHHLAYSLLRGRMKISEVKRFVIKKWAREYYELRLNHVFGFKNPKLAREIKDAYVKKIINNKIKWEVVWYAEPLIASLTDFEVFGIKHFLLNGKYKDL